MYCESYIRYPITYDIPLEKSLALIKETVQNKIFEKPKSYLDGIEKALFGELAEYKQGINLQHLFEKFIYQGF